LKLFIARTVVYAFFISAALFLVIAPIINPQVLIPYGIVALIALVIWAIVTVEDNDR
jgi:hypothetical protein